jgi:hypothetical protein
MTSLHCVVACFQLLESIRDAPILVIGAGGLGCEVRTMATLLCLLVHYHAIHDLLFFFNFKYDISILIAIVYSLSC